MLLSGPTTLSTMVNLNTVDISALENISKITMVLLLIVHSINVFNVMKIMLVQHSKSSLVVQDATLALNLLSQDLVQDFII